MQRVRYETNGGPDVLFTEEAAAPLPGPGQLLVRVEAVGVTLPSVLHVREGPAPGPLAGEVVGEVTAAGEGAGIQPGTRVAGMCLQDAYAEFVLLDRGMAAAVPAHVRAAEVVALVRSGLVARGACTAGLVGRGESVLVTAAAGATGVLAVQLAKAAGAERIVAAVSDAAKAPFALRYGADEVVTYPRMPPQHPVEVVLDGVGGELLGPAVRSLRRGGRLVAFASSGGSVDTRELVARNASATGFQMAALAGDKPGLFACWRDELWDWHRNGLLHAPVHAQYPLAEAAAAHQAVESRRTQGKVVLTTSGD
ncbi:quinone oxidoreductase family protein [Saccharopolyspora griseoalba]|uniref:Zinc-binding alcohol dehydrogenase family protein n=1 Tax=Saccharopolyspora griseoalba TaxID=1431848 RepID=A0ABW2LF82_9PSEU